MKNRTYYKLSMEDVLHNNKQNRYSVFERAKKRLIPEVWPEYTPTIDIDKDTKIFTIGSCFARNIEKYLAKAGYNVPMMLFSAPANESPSAPNALLNKYTPPSIYQELKWCERIYLNGGKVSLNSIEKLLLISNDEHVVDMHLYPYKFVAKERAIQRRQEVYNVFLEVFSSQVIIMTLGFVEAWYDSENDLYIQQFPSREMNSDKQRFKFVRLNYNECFHYIQESISLIREYNPSSSFIITTSPVSINRTFTKEDVIVANTYSKSILRAVCGEIVERNDRVDYLPSYENAILTKDWSIYQEDMCHVTDDFVEKIIIQFNEHYLKADRSFYDIHRAILDKDFKCALYMLAEYHNNQEYLSYILRYYPESEHLAHFFIALSSVYNKKIREALLSIQQGIQLAPENTQYHQLHSFISHLLNPGMKKTVIFGTGSVCEMVLKNFFKVENVDFFVDNDREKIGQTKYGKTIYSPEILRKEDGNCFYIIIASQFYPEISVQLNDFGFEPTCYFSYYEYFGNFQL